MKAICRAAPEVQGVPARDMAGWTAKQVAVGGNSNSRPFLIQPCKEEQLEGALTGAPVTDSSGSITPRSPLWMSWFLSLFVLSEMFVYIFLICFWSSIIYEASYTFGSNLVIWLRGYVFSMYILCRNSVLTIETLSSSTSVLHCSDHLPSTVENISDKHSNTISH